MIKLEKTYKDMIVFSYLDINGPDYDGCEDWLHLTPKEVLDSIKELQRGLFAWHEFTGEPVDKKECH